MNPDEFEHQISQRPIRPVPTEWRDEILDAARNAANVSAKIQPKTAAKSWLYSIFWPCPQAWAGLAAVWVALAIFNHAFATETRETMAVAKTEIISPEIKLAYKEQQRELAQLLQGFDEPVAEPPKPFVPRPRSEYRARIGLA